MNTNHVKLFIHLAETLNFSETSKALYISQPAVSQSIYALEDELNIKLFDRNKRSVKLTSSGRSFYEDAKSILIKLDLAIEKAKSYEKKERVSLSIGYSGTFYEIRMFPELIKEFNHKMPYVQLYLENSNHNIEKNGLLNQNYDIIFPTIDGLNSISNIEFVPLKQGKFVCILPINHLLANRKMIELTDLIDETIILFNYNQCPPKQIEVQERVKEKCKNATFYFSDSVVLSHTMVKGGLGVAVMPSFVTLPYQNDFAVVPLNEKDELVYGMAFLKSNKQKELREFIQCARNILGQTNEHNGEVLTFNN